MSTNKDDKSQATTAKIAAAKSIAARAKSGELIGLGSGTTAELAVLALADRIKQEGLTIDGMPTSAAIAEKAANAGIRIVSYVDTRELSWAFDGADEVDAKFNMIKGAGAAMFSEKLIAKRANGRLVIAVTADKIVDRLGIKFPIPVEVVPQALGYVRDAIKALGATEIVLRVGTGKYGPVVTEQGNFILDVRFDLVKEGLERELKLISGVLETGLFVGMTNELVVADAQGVSVRKLGI